MKFLRVSCVVALVASEWFGPGLMLADASPLRVVHPRKRHETIAARRHQPGSSTVEKRQECEYGSWRCQGQDLQRCLGGRYGTMRTCASDEVCSTDGGDTGCVWAWQKTVKAQDTGNITSTGPVSSSTAPAAATISSSASTSSSGTGSTSTSISVAAATSSVVSPESSAPVWSSSASSSVSSTFNWNAAPATPATPTTTTAATVSAWSSAGNWSEPTHTQSHNLSTLVPEPTSTPLPNLGDAHYVIYSDAWLTEMPHKSAVEGFNKFILAFWLSDKGAVDNAAFWEKLTQAEQMEVIKGYKEAGITLMVSAFGATDKPITAGKDPIVLARSLADWVKKNNMAGVDIDLEDNEAMNKNVAIAWIVSFQKELRAQLPKPILISHAPQAPWFTSASKWQGGYLQVHRECGDGIDFYNIQWYNQGSDQYHTCENLLFDSGPQYPDTSVFQIHDVSGLPLEKLVIGKPLTPTGAANGYMEPATLRRCVKQAREKGWNAGVMYWEWDHTA